MPTAGVAYNRVEVPPPQVAVGGILAVARVIDSNDPHDMLGAEYVSDACITDTRRWDRLCLDPAAEDKVFDDDAAVVQGDPFTLYQGVSCNLQNYAEQQARARNRFNYAERLGVDRAMADWLETNVTHDLGGPVALTAAIGAIENVAGEVYGGVPTLIIPAWLVGCACASRGLLPAIGGGLTTCQGGLVANTLSGSVGVGAPPDTATTDVIYATGQITLLRGPLHEVFAPQQPLGDGTYAPPRALAERTYVPLIECLVARVEVTCE